MAEDQTRGGKFYLWLSILILAASSSVVARLVSVGERSLIDGRNPISYCNLLFAGNMVAALVLLMVYRREWHPARLRQIKGRQWLVQLGLAASSGALAPALMFTAIERTSVTNIVLIETIEIPLGLLLAWLLYRERSNWTAVLGAGMALVGVGTALWLQMDMPAEMMQQGRMSGGIGGGEIYAVVGTVIFVMGATIGRKQLQTIPLGVFSAFRNLVGSAIFFAVVLLMFGPRHFIDIFSPVLWGWMLLYGGVVVVCGQLCWFSGIKRTTPADISLASAFSPVAGVIFALLILGEVPMSAQLVGGAVILGGIGIGLAGELRAAHREQRTQDKLKAFTGV